ncbi:uncharacterized protein LOC135168989 [Diachasmimorpha longicaudata]|uniref:uncharacterized protein LOC135168989 n=1 Tax=Diachasmimorpha longicaudata TaxID=58733 RepID=UPI0030B90782
MAQPYNRQYAVIWFVEEDKAQGERQIDVVPGSWIMQTSGDRYLCKYPPQKLYKRMPQLREEAAYPTWETFIVKILAGADTLEQANRRADRACRDIDCASTDTELMKTKKPPVLVKEKVNEILRNRISMRENVVTRVTAKATVESPRVQGGAKRKEVTLSSLSSTPKGKYNRVRVISSSDDTSQEDDPSPQRIDIPLQRDWRRSSGSPEMIIDSDAPNSSLQSNENRRVRSYSRNSVSKMSIDSEESLRRSVSETPKCSKTKQVPKECIDIEYIDKQFKALRAQIESTKRSILYDIEHKLKGLSLNITALKTENIQYDYKKIQETLGTTLPLTTLEGFLAFEAELDLIEDKKKALRQLMEYLSVNHSSTKECIIKVLPSVIDKNGQSHYSGQGMKKASAAKRCFKDTATYACFEAAMINRWGTCPKLISHVGVWLAKRQDREGGRKQRVKVGEILL